MNQWVAFSQPAERRIKKASISIVLALACHQDAMGAEPTQQQLASSIARTIVQACPERPPDSRSARDKCARMLEKSSLLRGVIKNPVLWGGQAKDGGYDISKSRTTRFNSLVWRKMYLSTFMFDGKFTIENSGSQTVIHLPCTFRYDLEIGEYSYPFWHSKVKWDSYEKTTELLLILNDGLLTAGLRSAVQDPNRPVKDHAWDGHWHWAAETGTDIQPRVSLYKYLFPNQNVAALDTAFRELEEHLRPYRCSECHSPNNLKDQNPLELFNYPNQALSARHRIVDVLEYTLMPPPPSQTIEQNELDALIILARRFANEGDKILGKLNESTNDSKEIVSAKKGYHLTRQ